MHTPSKTRCCCRGAPPCAAARLTLDLCGDGPGHRHTGQATPGRKGVRFRGLAGTADGSCCCVPAAHMHTNLSCHQQYRPLQSSTVLLCCCCCPQQTAYQNHGTLTMNCGMTLWKLLPLNPKPFSPVHSARKFCGKFQTDAADAKARHSTPLSTHLGRIWHGHGVYVACCAKLCVGVPTAPRAPPPETVQDSLSHHTTTNATQCGM